MVVNSRTLRHNCQMDMGSFTVSIIGPDPDDRDELADAARSLRSDLQEVSGITISPVESDEPTHGTRSALFVETVGSLAVLYYGGRMTGIARVIKAWSERNRGKKVVYKNGETEVEVSNMSEQGILDVLMLVGKPGEESAPEETD